ncbi:MAG: hypothetical protein CMO80_10105 [Verrucomicrobiales bacterium]|nr:hypothetical protein [Verrucomicrobiales bacterium]|tara:strand:+ start:796 stop:1296 length:501 start_codon:yes stop_codon:yes gene_type:complete
MQLQLIPLDRPNLDWLEHNARENMDKGTIESQEFHHLIVDILVQSRQLQESANASPPWVGYLAFDPAMNGIVGTCSFKSPPSEEGEVELAYFTFPQFEGKGYATAMANQLVSLALSRPGMNRVVAHTQPEETTSAHILEHLGFVCEGEVENIEDGVAWRWAKGREA